MCCTPQELGSKDTGTGLEVNGFRVGGVEGHPNVVSHADQGDLVGGTLDGEYGTLEMRTTGA